MRRMEENVVKSGVLCLGGNLEIPTSDKPYAFNL